MELEQFLNKTKTDITMQIEQVTSSWRTEVKKLTPELTIYFDLFVERLYGGKMIRGALVKLGYELIGERSNQDVYKIAAAVEIIHNSFLIHDDIMDKGLMRRGKKSLYNALGANHYAISQSISFGDLGFYLANKLVASTHFSASQIYQIQSIISDTVIFTCLGQMLDIDYTFKQKAITNERLLDLQRLKTARYSFTAPLVLGIILADGSKTLISDITKFGEYLGIAFQIQDDILGVFGDEETLGKSVTSDIEEGKYTFLLLYATQHGTKKQKEFLKNNYGKGKINKNVHKNIQEIFMQTGSVRNSEDLMNHYIEKANTVLNTLKGRESAKKLLYQLTEYIEKRNH